MFKRKKTKKGHEKVKYSTLQNATENDLIGRQKTAQLESDWHYVEIQEFEHHLKANQSFSCLNAATMPIVDIMSKRPSSIHLVKHHICNIAQRVTDQTKGVGPRCQSPPPPAFVQRI